MPIHEKIQEQVRQAFAEGKSGKEVALILKENQIASQEAEAELRSLGFFVVTVVSNEEEGLYISEGIVQPGLISLLIEAQYKNLPFVAWK